ncbi:MAG: sigma-70 family RNA polymerase sigma factor [Muribaculaceae bacterium]|nr:sigma-70 family RNA polymerase sigma factor [Muribaculaceae bacterium]
MISESLPYQCSKVMLLRYESGFSYADIAEELGISKVAVYKHLKNGLDQIRAKLFRKN